MVTLTIHPDVVYNTLASKPGRSERRNTLTQIHNICGGRYQNGIYDYSISSIGKVCEAEGILKARVLYNASSADYKVLIDTWSLYSASQPTDTCVENRGEKGERNTSKNLSQSLSRIEDSAVRSEVLSLLEERNHLRIKLRLADAATDALKLEIASREAYERMPVKQPRGRPLKNISEWTLKPGDLAALKKAISPEFITSQGWCLGSHGEIRNKLGETLYDFGYLQGLRKLLAKKNVE
jgi:hypothetical protein